MAESATNHRAETDLTQIPEALLRGLLQKRALTSEDCDIVLAQAFRQVAERLRAQGMAVFLLAKMPRRIQVRKVVFSVHAFGKDEKRRKLFLEKAGQLEKMIVPIEQTVAGQAMLRNDVFLIPDAMKVREFYDPIGWAPDFIIRSLLAMPLRNGGQAIGCVEALNKCTEFGQGAVFNSDDCLYLQNVAAYAARLVLRVGDNSPALGDRELARCMAFLSKCEFIDMDNDFTADHGLLSLIGAEKLRRYGVFPLARVSESGLRVAVANPQDYQRITDFEVVSGFKVVEKRVATEAGIRNALDKLLAENTQVTQVAESLAKEFVAEQPGVAVPKVTEAEDENSTLIVKLATRIIEDACTQGASDIHIEPYESKLLVRYRIDGVCRLKLTLPKQAHRALISRLKIMSELDIAEHRLPQDGRIIFHKFSGAHDIDVRVSIAPMTHGESAVLRILDKSKSTLPLENLGFSEHNLQLYRRMIQAPYGMILHVGPTGSGKSMTLFAALNAINSAEWKTVTAEDPIEYTLDGISQMQMKEEIGLTFASALRCFLRQDPDVILVGEIRDRETAEISIEAALTGHLLFSTLHTNDAASAITRLLDLNVEPFLIASTLQCICAQRLLRRLCVCKQTVSPSDEERELLARAKDGAPFGNVFKAGGCDVCDHSGYKGRIGIHELLPLTDELREIVARHGSALEFKEGGRRNGMRTLFEDAMEKVKAGISSMTEVQATVRADETVVAEKNP